MSAVAIVAVMLMTTPADTAIDKIVEDALRAWHVPGLAIAVVKDGKPLIVKGYGVRELGKPNPVTAETVFPLASCTKAFTTALLSMLVEERKLQWDDPVRKYYPTFHLSDPHADALVSVRDLVTHRTGVNGHDLLWYHSPRDANDILLRVGKLPLSLPFRGGYQYSTLMVMAAGKVAENAADAPWEDQVRNRICQPLGMKNVTFTTTDPKFLAAEKATGHRKSKAGIVAPCERYPCRVPNPAGSINLTANDLAAWLKFSLERKDETKTPQVVIPMDDALRRLNPDTLQMTYGMGWLVFDYRGRAVCAHGGLIDGFRTQVILLPRDGLGIALLNNLHDTKMNAAVTNAIVDHLLGLPPKDWNAILLAAVKVEDDQKQAAEKLILDQRGKSGKLSLPLEKYTGEYENPAYGTAAVAIKDGRLIWEWTSFKSAADHWGDESFRLTDGLLDEQFLDFKVTGGVVDAAKFQGVVFQRKQ